jgi:hypothetical protein
MSELIFIEAVLPEATRRLGHTSLPFEYCEGCHQSHAIENCRTRGFMTTELRKEVARLRQRLANYSGEPA